MIEIKALQNSKSQAIPMMDALMNLIDKIVQSDFKLNKNNGIIDFSEYLFVVPVKESGRLFRERLAEKYMEQGGVLSVKCVQVEYFLYSENKKKILTKSQILNLWNKVLANYYLNYNDAENNTTLFINEALKNNFSNLSWRLNMCKVLHDLRKEIALEQSMTVSEFTQMLKRSSHAGILTELSEKLEEYLTLEADFLKLKTDDFVDEAEQILHNMKNRSFVDKEVKKIILLDCCELKSSVITALNNLQDIAIELYLNVNENELKLFDKFGHAIPSKMQNVQIDLDFDKQLRVYSKPSKIAEKINHLVQQDSTKLPSCIGVIDSEITPYLEFLFRQNKLNIYVPKSYNLSEMTWTKLFLELLNFQKEQISFDEFAKLIRNGLYSNYLIKYCDIESYSTILKQCDLLQSRHLLTDMHNLKLFINSNPEDYSELLSIIELVEAIKTRVHQSDNIIFEIWSILSEIGAENDLKNIDIYLSQLELEALKEIIIELADIEDNSLQIELFKFLIRDRKIEAKGDNESAIDFTGFLEILWRDDRNILLAGFNEEMFNCSEASDMFLPEKVRELFGFTAQKERHAADIYHFYALNKAHNLAILVSKNSNSGDYLRPSKLLFYQNDEAIVKSCSSFFSGKLDENINYADDNGDKYLPYQIEFKRSNLQSISASAIKKYLTCPFNFYLENILKSEELNDRDIEINSMVAGNIIHDVLEIFGKLPDVHMLSAKEIELFLLDKLNYVVRSRYFGNTQNSLIQMQLSSYSEILRNFAYLQFDYMQGKENYKILKVEQKFSVDCNRLFNFNNNINKKINFNGKIDRIDSYIEDGIQVYELIDYKTSRNPKTPFEAHIKFVNPDKIDEDFEFTILKNPKSEDKKRLYYQFIDVQLPLYLAIMRHNLIDGVNCNNSIIRVKYCNLHSIVESCGFIDFVDCESFVNDAKILSSEVIERIFMKEIFWPPNFNSQYKARYQEIIGDISIENFQNLSNQELRG